MTTPERILIFVPDPTEASFIQKALATASLITDAATDTQHLTQLAITGQYRLLIADVREISGEGNPTLRYLLSQAPDLRIILLTEFQLLRECRRAADFGCEAFVPRPINAAELLGAVNSILQPEPALRRNEADFARVLIEDFIYGKNIPHSIYVRMKNGGFRKFAHQGENIDLDVIEQCKARGLGELWLTRGDFTAYMTRTRDAATAAAALAEMDEQLRARLIRHACDVAVENIRVMGVSENSIAPAVDALESAVRYVATHSSALSVLETIQQQSPPLYSQSVTCAILCGLLTRVLGWTNERHAHTLVMGALLRDIGMNLLPIHLQSLPPSEMNEDQLHTYRQHPVLGAELLKKVPNLPGEVVTIVQQHHENGRGTGFPTGRAAHQIFAMARIVTLVDEFCSLLLRLDPEARGEAPRLLRDLLAENPNTFDEHAAIALELLLTRRDPADAAREYALALTLR